MIFTNSSFEKIISAYYWIIEDDQSNKNDIASKFKAFECMFLGCQFIDDAIDLESDTALGAITLGTILNGKIDHRSISQILAYYGENYFRKANRLGISNIAIKAIAHGWRSYKELSHRLPGMLGYRERLFRDSKISTNSLRA